MDRAKLEFKLDKDFKAECSKQGYPLIDICLEEAYPGDTATSYIVNIVAEWAKNMDCSTALDILIDILWETTEIEYREAIFSINIYADNTLHCQSDKVNEYMRNPNLALL